MTKIERTILKIDVVDKEGDLFTKESVEKNIGKEVLLMPSFKPGADPIGKCHVKGFEGNELKADIEIFDSESDSKKDTFCVGGICHEHEDSKKDGKSIRLVKDFEIFEICSIEKKNSVYNEDCKC